MGTASGGVDERFLRHWRLRILPPCHVLVSVSDRMRRRQRHTGITTDVAARFDEHASGKGARYTRSRKPRAVLASFPLPDRSSASRAEYWVKQLTAVQKRELAAGLRTLESVLPAVVAVDTSGDEVGLKAGARGRKKAKNVDRAEKTVETGKSPKNAGKAGKAEKVDKPAKPPVSQGDKSRPGRTTQSPTTMGSQKDFIARHIGKDKPDAPGFVERKGACSQRQTHHERTRRCRARIASPPPGCYPSRRSAGGSCCPRRAKRTKDAPSTAPSPAAARRTQATPTHKTKPRGLLRRHARLAFGTAVGRCAAASCSSLRRR